MFTVLPLIPEDRRSMTKCWKGSLCWDRDRRLKRKRPGALAYTGSYGKGAVENVCPPLTEAPLGRVCRASLIRGALQQKYAVRDQGVQGKELKHEDPAWDQHRVSSEYL